jgi:hypothetical protein
MEAVHYFLEHDNLASAFAKFVRTFMLSWIWRVPGSVDKGKSKEGSLNESESSLITEDELDESLRVEGQSHKHNYSVGRRNISLCKRR